MDEKDLNLQKKVEELLEKINSEKNSVKRAIAVSKLKLLDERFKSQQKIIELREDYKTRREDIKDLVSEKIENRHDENEDMRDESRWLRDEAREQRDREIQDRRNEIIGEKHANLSKMKVLEEVLSDNKEYDPGSSDFMYADEVKEAGGIENFIDELNEIGQDGVAKRIRDTVELRKQYDEMPVRVEYNLTEKAKSLIPILLELKKWGEDNL